MYPNDTFISREAYVKTGGKASNKKLKITVGTTLPLMISLPAMIQEATLKSENNPTITEEDFDIIDPDYEDEKGTARYSILTVAKSPITRNRAVFYYDALFEDILVLANTAFLDIFDSNYAFNVGAFRIGGGHDLRNTQPHQVVATKQEYATKLPATKTSISNKSHIVMLPGMVPEHLVRNNAVEELIDTAKTLNLVRNTIQPSVLIELGKASDIFTTVNPLPLYLLAQTKLTEYSLSYLGNIKPDNNTIYISLTF